MGGEGKSRAMEWNRGRDRDEGKRGEEGGRHGGMKEGEVDENKKMKQRGESSLSLCSSGDDDGFTEATVNSLCHPSPTDTHTHAQKYTQSGGEIDLKSGGSVLTRPLFYSPHPSTHPIVITYQKTTFAAGMGGFTITPEPQQVFSHKDQISDCCLKPVYEHEFS